MIRIRIPQSEQARTGAGGSGTTVSSNDAGRFFSVEELSTHQPSPGAAVPALTGLLRRALHELKASTLGVVRNTGGPPRYFTRSAAAAQFFEELCRAGLETVREQALAKVGVFGTNRVKSHPEGPVRGRLLAVALRNTRGVPFGLLIATRLIDEEKFGADESSRLLALAPDFAAALL